MPIRGLHELLLERHLVQTDKLSVLKGTKLGIEGSQWLKKLKIIEPFQVAMGGCPLTMNSLLKEELAKFSEHQIKPVFVFNGLNLQKKDRPFTNIHNDVSVKRNWAWEAYEKGQVKEAAEAFLKNDKIIVMNFIPNIFQYFKEHDVEFFRSPYLAWAQLSWFSVPKQGLIHGIYSGLEALLFGAPRLIIDIDFKRGTFDWIDQRSILRELGLNFDQFLDACILAGCDYCKTFPPLNLTTSDEKYIFSSSCEMVKGWKNGYHAIIQNSTPQKRPYLDVFLRAKMLALHHPIFELNRCCEPLNKEICPNDLHEIIGPRLPNEVYFLLSQGVINPQVINNLINGFLVEAPPLVDSSDYHSTLDKLMDIRSRTIGLLSSCLHNYWKKKQVKTVRWYDPQKEHDLDHSMHHPALNDLLRMNVSDNEMKNEMKRHQLSLEQLGLSFVVHCMSEKNRVQVLENYLLANDPSFAIQSAEHMTCMILIQFLCLTGYLTAETGLTKYGKAISVIDADFEAEILAFCELLKFEQSFTKSLATEKETRKEINLIAKVMSLSPAHLKDIPWEGPIDHELMAFNSITKAIYRSLRNLLEMLLLFLYLRRKAHMREGVFAQQDYLRISFILPFFQESNTASGILFKQFLTGENLDQLKKVLPCFVDPLAELTRGFKFWDQVMKVMERLHTFGEVTDEVYQDFSQANQLLINTRATHNI